VSAPEYDANRHSDLRHEADSLAQSMKRFTKAMTRVDGELLGLVAVTGDLFVEAFVRQDAPALLRGIRWIYKGGSLCADVISVGAARLSGALLVTKEALRAENDLNGAPTSAEFNAIVDPAVAAVSGNESPEGESTTG